VTVLLPALTPPRVRHVARSVLLALPRLVEIEALSWVGKGNGNLCGIAADGVTRALRGAGYEATFVYGVFVRGNGRYAYRHCWTWLPAERLVVDITATQFNDFGRREFGSVRVVGLEAVRRPRSWRGWRRVLRGPPSYVPLHTDADAERVMRRSHILAGHRVPAWGDGHPARYRRRRWWTERWLQTFGEFSERALPDIQRELVATSAERSA
jgi:hypothetical protein